jgi:hypothetical protein
VSLQLNIEAHLKGACITLISLYSLMKDLSKWRDDHSSLPYFPSLHDHTGGNTLPGVLLFWPIL